MSTAPKYKPGDRVVHHFLGTRKHGSVRTATRASAMVDFDDGTQERVSPGTLSPETAEDVARRDHEQAMRKWNERKPRTTHARAAIPMSYGNTDWIGAEILGVLKTPDDMRHAAAELLKLADWFAERPVKP